METSRCHKPSYELVPPVAPLHLLMMMMKPYMNRVAFEPVTSGCLLALFLSFILNLSK